MSDFHAFARPIHTVAIIGLGASGAPAARHLRDAGLEVTVFERQSTAGGIWNWSPDTTPVSVPTPPPSRGAFEPALPTLGTRILQEADTNFSPPNPVYWNLTNNVPTSTMAFKDFPYPTGTPENVPHHQLSGYIKAYVAHFGLERITRFNTRVELAEKSGSGWRLSLREVVSVTDGIRETFLVQDVDALLIATGHYTAPYIPHLPGAAEWASSWQMNVLHTKGYRHPEPYTGKNVLIVGIGTSGIDIARDLAPHAAHIYMVGKPVRGPNSYRAQRLFQRRLLPQNAEEVAPIRRFYPPPSKAMEEAVVELEDGRKLSGISLVLFATGYQYSLPFLPHLHRDPPSPLTMDEKKRLLITDGGGVLNLFRDVFFIPDPTLTFLGLSVNTSAFNFFEFQSISVARVFTGTARLPDEAGRWAVYDEWVREKGEGKWTHLMGKEGERRYVRETVEWLNREREELGLQDEVEAVVGHSPEWIEKSNGTKSDLARKYGVSEKLWEEVMEEISKEKKKKEEEEVYCQRERAEQVEKTSNEEERVSEKNEHIDSNERGKDYLMLASERPLPVKRFVLAS